MLRLAKKEWGMIVLIGLLTGAFSFAVLIGTQKNFRANSDLLAVQNQNGFSDYYALSKSADYLAGILIESIYSEKFLEEVNATGVVSINFLPADKLERLEEWNRIVKVSKNSNTGMLNIEVLGDTQKQVLEISNAILKVLTTKSYLFLGKGQDIEIRILSGPLYEKNPSMLNIALAFGGGFLIGFLLMLMRIFYKVEFGKYRNIFPLSRLEENLTPEEITERNAMEYWKIKNGQ